MVASKDCSRNYKEAFLLNVSKLGKRILAAIALPNNFFNHESYKILQQTDWDTEE